MITERFQQIQAFKESGMTPIQVADSLNLSISTVREFWTREAWENRLNRNRNWRRNNVLREKIYRFGGTFSPDELVAKCGNKCYLTGRTLDLSDPSDYSLDHIIPRSKGGNNSLVNCALACSKVNKAKGPFTHNEFIGICISVVEHFS